MPQHLKMFEWLSYAGLALGTVSIFLSRPPTGELIATLIFVVIAAALIWAAARKGQAWAAWVLVVLLVLGAVVVITYFTGSGTPRWLSWLRPEKPPTTLQKVLDVVTEILSAAGLYFYFFGNRQATSQT